MTVAEQAVTTYLLHGLTRFDVAEIRSMDPPYFETGKNGRGVLVAAFPPPNAARIGRRLQGDNRDVVGGWLDQNVVEALMAEYRRTRPGAEAQEEALSSWRKAHEHRVLLEHENRELSARWKELHARIEAAKEREREASEVLVKVVGKTVIESGGDYWELRNSRGGLLFKRAKD